MSIEDDFVQRGCEFESLHSRDNFDFFFLLDQSILLDSCVRSNLATRTLRMVGLKTKNIFV